MTDQPFGQKMAQENPIPHVRDMLVELWQKRADFSEEKLKLVLAALRKDRTTIMEAAGASDADLKQMGTHEDVAGTPGDERRYGEVRGLISDLLHLVDTWGKETRVREACAKVFQSLNDLFERVHLQTSTNVRAFAEANNPTSGRHSGQEGRPGSSS
jgi:hypothetical protein